MKKLTRIASIAATALFATGSLLAQNSNYCATDEMVKRSLEANPQLKADYTAEQERLDALDKAAARDGYKESKDEKAMLPVYIIPVVFHVIHQNGTENISDAQIQDEVRILNQDYRKLNPDITAVVSSFTSITADCEIEFRLAQKDPNGICTNGIDRIFSPLTNAADDNSKLNPWPRNKYLNIWTVKTIGTAGVAGYAYLPGTAFPTTADGVLILSDYIGSIGTGHASTSRALTHEIGHFLNLQHTWGNTNNPGVACGDDAVTAQRHHANARLAHGDARAAGAGERSITALISPAMPAPPSRPSWETLLRTWPFGLAVICVLLLVVLRIRRFKRR